MLKKDMKERSKTGISKANTLEETGELKDTHRFADYWDQAKEVDFNIRAARRHSITIDPDIYEKIIRHSCKNGVMPETLIHLWLAEKLRETEFVMDQNNTLSTSPAAAT